MLRLKSFLTGHRAASSWEAHHPKGSPRGRAEHRVDDVAHDRRADARVRRAPGSTPNGAVVLLQEAFGVNDHIQDSTRRFADRGYLAVAPELFHRTGPEVVAYDDHPQAMALIGALGPEQITTDANAVLEHLDGEEGIDLAHTAIVGSASADGPPLLPRPRLQAWARPWCSTVPESRPVPCRGGPGRLHHRADVDACRCGRPDDSCRARGRDQQRDECGRHRVRPTRVPRGRARLRL